MVEVVIHDLGLAAFLRAIKGKKMLDNPYRDEHGRFCFKFQLDSEEEKKRLVMEYFDSAFRTFDQEVKALKRAITQ